jgi:hypothetical protein
MSANLIHQILEAHLRDDRVCERDVLLAGGLLARLRAGGPSFSVCLGQSGAVEQGSPITTPVADSPFS